MESNWRLLLVAFRLNVLEMNVNWDEKWKCIKLWKEKIFCLHREDIQRVGKKAKFFTFETWFFFCSYLSLVYAPLKQLTLMKFLCKRKAKESRDEEKKNFNQHAFIHFPFSFFIYQIKHYSCITLFRKNFLKEVFLGDGLGWCRNEMRKFIWEGKGT